MHNATREAHLYKGYRIVSSARKSPLDWLGRWYGVTYLSRGATTTILAFDDRFFFSEAGARGYAGRSACAIVDGFHFGEESLQFAMQT